MTLDLRSLNPEQRLAVTTTEGPLLVLAGAGSGKTRVITARIAYLIEQRGVPPEAILAVTFTNKAAREMAGRVRDLVRGRDRAPLLCTFHAFGMRLLRAHGGLVGLRPRFVIVDTQDQQGLVKTIMEEGGHDMAFYPPKQVHYALQKAKSEGLTAEALTAPGHAPDQQVVGQVLAEYQAALSAMNGIDFEDILLLARRLCREHPAEAQGWFHQFRYVMVDEYQDTNRIQYDLLRAATAAHGNLCVVGDDDQSIYRWRGAEPGNILDFEADFPGARVVRLERNYRSTDTILAAANQVIRHNCARHEKDLHGGQGAGEPLAWLLAEHEPEEMELMLTHLRRTRMETGRPLSDFAVLYRSNHQSRVVEEALRDEGIPYLLVGGTRFYDRKEVRDALAYLRVVANPSDEVSLYRILNFPRRGIGPAGRARAGELAAARGRPLFEIMREASHHPAIPAESARAMERFAQLITGHGERFRAGPLGAAFRHLLAELDFHRAVEKERPDAKAGERASALVRELELAVDRFGREREGASLNDYLEHVALFTMPGDEEEQGGAPAVSLMTVHGAKGLEFPFVYLVGMAEEVFPHARALAEGGEEEERRLFYVAITRARQRLAFSMAKTRRRYGATLTQQPSRFLLEIAPELFAGEVPAGTPRTAIARAAQTAQAKARFYDQMRKLKEGAGGG